MNIGRSIHRSIDGIVARAYKGTNESSDQADKKARGMAFLIILWCLSILATQKRHATVYKEVSITDYRLRAFLYRENIRENIRRF
mmetsp:Transcript_17705/g.43175  ORF Transcript_17705/g.43175 Transcript_17705/m.43175 type:complete len:85 (+) Transcript_17705:1538-1792(+)